MARIHGVRPRRTARRSLAAAVGALLTLTLVSTATAGSPAKIVVNGGGAGSSAANPVIVTAGSATGQVVTFSNSDKSKSTTALVVTPPGNGFSIVSDGCTGLALGPRKSCTVRVAFLASAPPTGQTAQLRIASKTPPPAEGIAYLRVNTLAPADMCRYYGAIPTMNGRVFVGCQFELSGLPPTNYDEVNAAFTASCGTPVWGYSTFDDQGMFRNGTASWYVGVSCRELDEVPDEECADVGGVIDLPLGAYWRCAEVALPDQAAADALAAELRPVCDRLYNAFDRGVLMPSVEPQGNGLVATFLCQAPPGAEPGLLCRYYAGAPDISTLVRYVETTPSYHPDGTLDECRIVWAAPSFDSGIHAETLRRYFTMGCQANGISEPFMALAPGPASDDPQWTNYSATFSCPSPHPEATTLCSEQEVLLPLRSHQPSVLWACGGVQLTDQGAADDLAAQFSDICADEQPAGAYRFDYSSSSPFGSGVRASYICRDPNAVELCTESGGVMDNDGAYWFRCSGAGLPDALALEALTAGLEAFCLEGGGLSLDVTTTPDGEGLRATFTCLAEF
jgi:hypothetical protein